MTFYLILSHLQPQHGLYIVYIQIKSIKYVKKIKYGDLPKQIAVRFLFCKVVNKHIHLFIKRLHTVGQNRIFGKVACKDTLV